MKNKVDKDTRWRCPFTECCNTTNTRFNTVAGLIRHMLKKHHDEEVTRYLRSVMSAKK